VEDWAKLLSDGVTVTAMLGNLITAIS